MKLCKENISYIVSEWERHCVEKAFELAEISLVDQLELASFQASIFILGEYKSLEKITCVGTPDLLIVFGKTSRYLTAAKKIIYWQGDVEALAKELSAWMYAPAPEIPGELNMVGESPALMYLVSMIKRIALAEASVLIKGETGTGKEVTARAVHYLSPRQDGPFVPVNCGAYSDDLFISEFFGFERGSFTDAKESRVGFVEQAEGGTLFLDEIDSLSAKAQVTLLRFLQNYEFRRLGSKSSRRANVRLVAASNKPLKKLVENNVFREDLFYRLDILSLDVPALRDRIDDLMPLCTHFLDVFSRQYSKPMKYLSEGTLRWMLSYKWPGNIRELENYIHKIYVVCPRSEINIHQTKGLPELDIPHFQEKDSIDEIAPFKVEKNKIVEAFEREYLNKIMAKCEGNISKAARIAGKERRDFTRLIEKHGYQRRYFSSESP